MNDHQDDHQRNSQWNARMSDPKRHEKLDCLRQEAAPISKHPYDYEQSTTAFLTAILLESYYY